MGYSNTQLGSGNASLFDNNTLNILGDQGFNSYIGGLGNVDLNNKTPDEVKALAADYTKFGNTINGYNTGVTTDGILNTIGGYFNTDGQTLKDIGGGLGGLIGFSNTLFDMKHKNQAAKIASDNYNFQKGIMLDKINTAKADKAKFLADQAAATKSYYGK